MKQVQEIGALHEAMHVLVAHAEGRARHLFNGQCPDAVEGHAARDPQCLVCQSLGIVQRRIQDT